jgi:hypothetical protein
VIAKQCEELDAWQLADELRREVLMLTETGPAHNDFKFRDQIRDAASSAARNISEGFGRFRPPEFARFMEFSISSDTTKRVRDLTRRTLQVSRGLLRYLKRCGKHPERTSKPPERRAKSPERSRLPEDS